jgi:hypothetical protein
MNTGSRLWEGLLVAPLAFSARPVDLPAELRPAWRGAFLLIVLGYCHGKKASIETLHFLNWAAGTHSSRRQAQEALSVPASLHASLPVRFDPAVSRSLEYLSAEKLVVVEGGRNILTEKGKALSQQLIDNGDLFSIEKAFLTAIKPINDTRIKSVFPRGSYGAVR